MAFYAAADQGPATGNAVFDADLELLTQRLLSHDVQDYRNHVQLSSAECLTVCHLAVEKLKTQDCCLMLQSPLNIVGDLHGQLHDLLRLFDSLGKPPATRYLFLGDYVDRGRYSLEVITLLMCMMLMHPKSVFLLRGNHETGNVCCRYGFRAEVLQRYSKSQANNVLVGFLRVFQWLPLCAIVDNRLFCCHGGLSPSFLLPPFNTNAGRSANLQTLDSQIHRPLEPKKSGIAIDLLWSDPASTMPLMPACQTSEKTLEAKWVPNVMRQCSYIFSSSALQEVMHIFHTHMLVRGHQLAQDGFKVNHEKRCITIFSAPGYCGTQNNAAAILQVSQSSKQGQEAGTFFVMKAMRRTAKDIEQLFWTEFNESS